MTGLELSYECTLPTQGLAAGYVKLWIPAATSLVIFLFLQVTALKT